MDFESVVGRQEISVGMRKLSMVRDCILSLSDVFLSYSHLTCIALVFWGCVAFYHDRYLNLIPLDV